MRKKLHLKVHDATKETFGKRFNKIRKYSYNEIYEIKYRKKLNSAVCHGRNSSLKTWKSKVKKNNHIFFF